MQYLKSYQKNIYIYIYIYINSAPFPPIFFFNVEKKKDKKNNKNMLVENKHKNTS